MSLPSKSYLIGCGISIFDAVPQMGGMNEADEDSRDAIRITDWPRSDDTL